MIPLWADSNDWATIKATTNQAIALLNSMTNAIVPIGVPLPYYGNTNDPALFDINGVGVAGSEMERFALCYGQGLSGSSLKNYDGSAKSTTPNLIGRFLYGMDPGAPALGATAGAETHKHVWSERATSTNKTWNVLGALKDWLFLTEQRGTGAVSTAAAATTYNAEFSDGKSYTDTASSMPPYMVVAYIIRYK